MLRSLGGYDLTGELGRGGMGAVYRARHRATGAVRALKVLGGVTDLEALERFRREAIALAKLGGDGVVPVHETGTERGAAYFVMDLLPGGSLRARLDREGRLPWREAAFLVASLARILERCHIAGIVHRDVKPENVLFDELGKPRLADFGLARDVSADSLTVTGSGLGTPAYMSPEQVSDAKAVTGAADIYSLGVVLYELLAGRRPYTGNSIHELALNAMAGKREPLSSLAPVPGAIEEAVARALAPRPQDRFESMGELAAALEAAAEGKESATTGGGPPRLLLVLVFSVLALGAVFAGRWFARSAPPPPPAPAPPPTPRASRFQYLGANPSDEQVEAAAERALGGPRDPADAAAIGMLAAAHRGPLIRLLAAREKLARRERAEGLALLEGNGAPGAAQLLAAAKAADVLAGSLSGSVERCATGPLRDAVTRVRNDDRIRDAIPGILLPLDAAAREAIATSEGRDPFGTAHGLYGVLKDVAGTLPPDTRSGAVAVAHLLPVFFVDRPATLTMAQLVVLGETGAEIADTEPTLGWMIVERVLFKTHENDDAPAERLVAIAEAVEAREDAARKGAEREGSAWFEAFRWRQLRHHSTLERRLAKAARADRAKCQEHLRRALDLRKRAIAATDPTVTKANDWFDVARLFLALGNTEEATRAMDHVPPNLVQLIAAEACRLNGDPGGAITQMDRFIAQGAVGLRAAYGIRARAKIDQGSLEAAAQDIASLRRCNGDPFFGEDPDVLEEALAAKRAQK